MILKKIRELWELLYSSITNFSDRNSISFNLLPNTRNSGVVIGISVLVALILWIFVNLSQSYLLTLEVNVEVGELAEGYALKESLPESITVGVESEGWLLLRLAIRNPKLVLNIPDTQRINLIDPLNESLLDGIQINRIEPSIIKPNLETEITKKVPIIADLELNYKTQFYPTASPLVKPDSVIITGASSIIRDIRFVKTGTAQLADISEPIDLRAGLELPALVSSDVSIVEIKVDVSAFTETVSKVPVQILNVPEGIEIQLSPLEVDIRYDIPLSEYNKILRSIPFVAQIDYRDIENNQNGLLTPEIRKTGQFNEVIYKSHEPKRIRYFQQLNQ